MQSLMGGHIAPKKENVSQPPNRADSTKPSFSRALGGPCPGASPESRPRNFASIAFSGTADIIVGGIMRRSISLAMVLLSVSGCLTPITRRLDGVNSQLQTTNQNIQESNQRLERLEKLEEQLRTINAKLLDIEKALPNLGSCPP